MLNEIAPLVVAAVLLTLVIALAFRRWVAGHWTTLDGAQRAQLALVLVTMAGGFVGAFAWWADDARSFTWDLPPLASRMLAAAGWSFAALSVMVLARPTAQRVRLSNVLLFVYLAPLAAAILAFHLDRFDFAKPITYSFFIIVGGMTAAATWFLVRPARTIILDRDGADEASAGPVATRPPQPAARIWLMAVALITAAWGLALFATDSGPLALIWTWTGDLLTSRLIGVMLLTVATASVMSLSSVDVADASLAMTAVYGAGLSVASLWNQLAGKPLKPAYAIVFAVIALGSIVLRRGLASRR